MISHLGLQYGHVTLVSGYSVWQLSIDRNVDELSS